MKSTFRSEEEVSLVERLYTQYRNLLYKVANDVVHDPHLAEEAIQLTFERVLKNVHKIDKENVPKTKNFLVTICKNVAITLYNQRKRGTENIQWVPDLPSEEYDPEKIVISKHSKAIIKKVVAELPQIYSDVLVLRVDYRMSRNDIAELLGIEPNNVKRRLWIARNKIAKALEEEGLM